MAASFIGLALWLSPMDRRDFLLGTSVGGVIGIVGGATVLERYVRDFVGPEDSDGDGVVNREDYAPWDPDVQEQSDLVTTTDTPTPTSTDTSPSTDTHTASPSQSIQTIADFEDGDVSGWELAAAEEIDGSSTRTRSDEWNATTETSVEGSYSAKLSTNNGKEKVIRELSSPSQPVGMSFWIRYDGQLNSQDTAKTHLQSQERETFITVEHDRFQSGRVVILHDEETDLLSGEQTQNQWLLFDLYDIDWEESNFSLRVNNTANENLVSHADLSFSNDINDLQYFVFRNRNNISNNPIYLDDLSLRYR